MVSRQLSAVGGVAIAPPNWLDVLMYRCHPPHSRTPGWRRQQRSPRLQRRENCTRGAGRKPATSRIDKMLQSQASLGGGQRECNDTPAHRQMDGHPRTRTMELFGLSALRRHYAAGTSSFFFVFDRFAPRRLRRSPSFELLFLRTRFETRLSIPVFLRDLFLRAVVF